MMTKHFPNVSVFPLVTAALLLASAAWSQTVRAQQEQPFAEAQLFLELNDTDGDLGLHAVIDGEPWTSLTIEGPGERHLLDVVTSGRLRAHGLTELSFESAEPAFDELPPAAFFRRFPEGRYEIEARLQTGGELESTAVLSHVLAAPPDNVRVSNVPAAPSCDEEPLPAVSPPVTISWEPVTQSHPEIGRRGRIRVVEYQLFVEGGGVNLGIDLPPTITQFKIPTAITDRGREFKFEIIVRTAAGNNTAVESCFRMN
jgi:hypothetical protein